MTDLVRIDVIPLSELKLHGKLFRVLLKKSSGAVVLRRTREGWETVTEEELDED